MQACQELVPRVVGVEVRHVHDLGSLGLHRGNHLRMAVADDGGSVAGAADVEHASAIRKMQRRVFGVGHMEVFEWKEMQEAHWITVPCPCRAF